MGRGSGEKVGRKRLWRGSVVRFGEVVQVFGGQGLWSESWWREVVE